jgi:hypothetical protein
MARPGGYIQSGEECYRFRHAACTEDGHGGLLSIEAEGEQALFLLPNLVWQSRTGWIQDILHFPWPYDMPWRLPEADRLDRLGFVEVPDLDPLTDCGLWVPGRLLAVVKVQVEFEEVDVPRSLVSAAIRVVGMSEAGDFCQEFDLWLCCAYNGALGAWDW